MHVTITPYAKPADLTRQIIITALIAGQEYIRPTLQCRVTRSSEVDQLFALDSDSLSQVA